MRVNRSLPYLFALLAALLLAVFEPDLLYTAEEHSLFLDTPFFLEQQMVRAGGLLTWAGCYLTQFFYYPLLGATILGLLWAFLVWIIRYTFDIKSPWLALFPVLCLLMTITTLGYWVYYLKLPGVLFDATLGTIVAMALVLLYRRLPDRYFLRPLLIALSTCITYPLFGFYGLWATLMMGIIAEHNRTKTQRLSAVVLALLSIIAVPLLCYHYVYHETNIVNIYWTALPVYSVQGARSFNYYTPYILLVVSICLMAVFMGHEVTETRRTSVVVKVCWSVGALLTLTAVVVSWNRDANFHRELAMQRCIEKQAWEEVLSTVHKWKGEPTRAVCMMQNLALYRLGRTGDEIFMYPHGAARPNAPFPIQSVHTIGKQLYLQYGVVNYCYRWCMEDGVEYGWTVERLKLMAKCSLLNGEMAVAQRFLNLLKKTTFHRGWAKRYETFVHQPQLMMHDPELAPILPLLRTDDFLTSDQSQLEMFLIEQLISTPGNTREQRDLANFIMRYYRRNQHPLVEK